MFRIPNFYEDAPTFEDAAKTITSHGSGDMLEGMECLNCLELLNMSLINHIKEINETGRKLMADKPSLFVGMLTEDLAHWESYGITTPTQFDRYINEQTLYELVSNEYSKSFARSIGISSMSEEELTEELSSYGSYEVTPLTV